MLHIGTTDQNDLSVDTRVHPGVRRNIKLRQRTEVKEKTGRKELVTVYTVTGVLRFGEETKSKNQTKDEDDEDVIDHSNHRCPYMSQKGGVLRRLVKDSNTSQSGRRTCSSLGE